MELQNENNDGTITFQIYLFGMKQQEESQIMNNGYLEEISDFCRKMFKHFRLFAYLGIPGVSVQESPSPVVRCC